MTTTIRLTTAQALVKFLTQQMTIIDGKKTPIFAGVWAIFGHGNVVGMGEALFQVRDQLPTYRGQNEQSMALAAIAFAKASNRKRVMAATSSIGPGALNMVTAAAVAHVNRIPLLLLPGDTFANRKPDPGLKQSLTDMVPSPKSSICCKTGSGLRLAKTSPGSNKSGIRLTWATAAAVTMFNAPGPMELVAAMTRLRFEALAKAMAASAMLCSFWPR